MTLNEIINIDRVSKSSDLYLKLVHNWIEGEKIDRPIKILGKLSGYEIQYMEIPQYKGYYYGLFDKNKNQFAFFLELSKFGRTTKCLQVEMAGIKDEYSGMNLPIKLYSWLILQQGIVMVSGFEQSIGGRSIWERLAKVSGVFIFGYDTKTKTSFQLDQNDIYNEDIYSRDVTDEYNDLIQQRNSSSDKNEINKLTTQIKSLNNTIRNTFNIRLVAIKNTNRK
jgi:hypothetical protein